MSSQDDKTLILGRFIGQKDAGVKMAFFRADILTFDLFIIILTLALFYSSVQVSQDSVAVIQHAQYSDPETNAPKWNSAIIQFDLQLCFFPL